MSMCRCIDGWQGVRCGTSLWPPGQDECEDELSCAALGWDPASRGHPGVCGSSALKGVGGCGPDSQTFYTGAERLCADLGARLCSVHELALDEANAAECNLNLPTAWTWSSDSDGCPPGHHLVAGGASGDWISFESMPDVDFQIVVNGTRADQLEIDGMYDTTAQRVGLDLTSFVSGDRVVVRWNSDQVSGPVFFHVHRLDERTDPYSLSILATVSYSWTAEVLATNDAQPAVETDLGLDDDSAVAIVLPWEFPWFGRPRKRLWVTDNGMLSFADESPPTVRNEIGRSFEHALIAPLWTDLRPDLPGAAVSTSATADSFRVHWNAPAVERSNICESALPNVFIPELDHVRAVMYTPEPLVLTHSYGSVEPPYSRSLGEVGGLSYIGGVDCSVILRARPGHHVELTLDTINVDSGATTDFLFLHDGSTVQDPALASPVCCNPTQAGWCETRSAGWGDTNKLSCGQLDPEYCGLSARSDSDYTGPRTFVSSGTDLLVRWRTSCHHGDAIGFSAHWEHVPEGRTEPMPPTPPVHDFEVELRRDGSVSFVYNSLVPSNQSWTGVSNDHDASPLAIGSDNLANDPGFPVAIGIQEDSTGYHASACEDIIDLSGAPEHLICEDAVRLYGCETDLHTIPVFQDGSVDYDVGSLLHLSCPMTCGMCTNTAAGSNASMSTLRAEQGVYDICNSHVETSSGTITDGNSNYVPFMDCGILLHSGGGSQSAFWRVEFSMLQTEAGYDFVSIYDGPSPAAPELARLAGDSLPENGLQSTGPDMFIKFESDDSVEAAGFELTFRLLDERRWSPADVAVAATADGSMLHRSYAHQSTHCFEDAAAQLAVQCCAEAFSDCSTTRVVGLELRDRDLRGTISDAIGSLSALTTIDLTDNFVGGTLPHSIHNLHLLRTLRLEHNQLQLALDHDGAADFATMLQGFADLRTLELSTSLETVDLTKTLVNPVPPIDCAVGVDCSFIITTRTASSIPMSRGGQRIIVELINSPFTRLDEAHFVCTDSKDGTYSCDVPATWIGSAGILEFRLLADSAEIVPMRTIENPESGVTITAQTYPLLAIDVAPISCIDVRAHPNEDGSACVCAAGFIRVPLPGGGQVCQTCERGQQPSVDREHCEDCAFGTQSAAGTECSSCPPGEAPNRNQAAYLCVQCSPTMFSETGARCVTCPPGQIGNDARTGCICPPSTYNSTKYNGNTLQCVQQDLNQEDIPAESICMSCESLACIVCENDGLRVREGWAFSVTPTPDSSPSNIYRCPIESACVNTPERLCKEGTDGLLCAVCEDSYGFVGDECRLCSETARSHSLTFGIVVLAGVICVGGYYFWRRRSSGDGNMAGQLTTDNPLAASLSIERTKPEAHDLGLWFRALYQPVRILIGYGQVRNRRLHSCLIFPIDLPRQILDRNQKLY